MKVRTQDLAQYARAGLTLIPLHRFDHVDERGRQRGKSPRHSNWLKREYDPRDVVREAEERGTNVGVRLPPTVVVVDVDPRNFPEGRDVMAELAGELGLDLSVAPHVTTGSGGDHYYFRKPADVPLMDSLTDFPGVEFKSHGRQVVAAGSVHPNGRHYEWDDFAPFLWEMPDLPPRLLAMARRPQRDGVGNGAGELTPERLAELLEQLDPEDFRDHDRWLELMMASHHGTNGEGRQEFIDWSTSDPEYADDGWGIGRRWDSLHVDRGGKSVTVRTLYKEVLSRGGEVPVDPPEADFEPWEDGDELRAEGDETPPGERARSTLDELNERHCVVMDGGRFRIFTSKWDPVLKRHYYTRSSKTDFEDEYGNRLVEVGDKLLPLGHWWLRQPGRRQYEGVIFDPERDHEGWLNLWRGWAVEPRRGDWSLLKELLAEVLCDGSTEAFEYAMNWAAGVVQRPGSPGEVAVFFRGEKGTGKGTFCRALANLAGTHGMHISSPTHLTGRFNSHLKDCIVLFSDEAFWAGDKASESVLKALVTEPTLVFEGKGRDAETGRNLIHLIGASNEEWVVPAGLDNERRFAVFDVNNRWQGDHARFDALNRQLREGGLEAMLYELMTRDIRGWHPRVGIPQTQALVNQKLRSMDPLEAWWHHRLSEGVLPGERTEWRAGWTVVLKEYVRRDYSSFCRDLGVRRTLSPIQFGHALPKLCPGVEARQVRLSDEEWGTVEGSDKGARVMAYHVPPLAECRAAFERKVGARLTWEVPL